MSGRFSLSSIGQRGANLSAPRGRPAREVQWRAAGTPFGRWTPRAAMRDTVGSGGTRQAEDAVPSPRHPDAVPDPEGITTSPTCRSACSTRASAGSPSCTSAWWRSRRRTSSTWATPPASPTAPGRRASCRPSRSRSPPSWSAPASSSSSWPATRPRRRRLPALQERFETPIVGIVMPGARAAVQSSRYRRIGVMATEATVASGSYVRAIHSLDAGAEVHQQACPGLAEFIQEGDVFSPGPGRDGARLHGAAEGACARTWSSWAARTTR